MPLEGQDLGSELASSGYDEHGNRIPDEANSATETAEQDEVSQLIDQAIDKLRLGDFDSVDQLLESPSLSRDEIERFQQEIANDQRFKPALADGFYQYILNFEGSDFNYDWLSMAHEVFEIDFSADERFKQTAVKEKLASIVNQFDDVFSHSGLYNLNCLYESGLISRNEQVDQKAKELFSAQENHLTGDLLLAYKSGLIDNSEELELCVREILEKTVRRGDLSNYLFEERFDDCREIDQFRSAFESGLVSEQNKLFFIDQISKLGDLNQLYENKVINHTEELTKKAGQLLEQETDLGILSAAYGLGLITRSETLELKVRSLLERVNFDDMPINDNFNTLSSALENGLVSESNKLFLKNELAEEELNAQELFVDKKDGVLRPAYCESVAKFYDKFVALDLIDHTSIVQESLELARQIFAPSPSPDSDTSGLEDNVPNLGDRVFFINRLFSQFSSTNLSRDIKTALAADKEFQQQLNNKQRLFFTKLNDMHLDESSDDNYPYLEHLLSNLDDLPDADVETGLDVLGKLQARDILHTTFKTDEERFFTALPSSVKKHHGISYGTPLIHEIDSSPEAVEQLAPDKNNILDLLAAFMDLDAQDWRSNWLSSELKDKVKAIFDENHNENKNLALNAMRQLWLDYLQRDPQQLESFPVVLDALAQHNASTDGAGPLTQIESFLDFILAYDQLITCGDFSTDTVLAPEKKANLFNQSKAIEARFAREHWDQNEISNFYYVSTEILAATGGLYNDFLDFFGKIKNKEYFAKFVKEIYPLYRTKLTLLKKYYDHSNGIGEGYTSSNYLHLDLGRLRRDLRATLEIFDANELSPEKTHADFQKIREIILNEIKAELHNKFDILPGAIPDEFSDQQLASMENLTLYSSNIAHRNHQKETWLGFYLALHLQGSGEDTGWQRLRRGKINSADGLLEPDKAQIINESLIKQKQDTFFTSENLQLPDSEVANFIATLQKEVTTMNLSSVETIDLKLQNLIGNLQELTDEDYYLEPIEKGLMRILSQTDTKNFNRIVAGLYQEQSGKSIHWSEADLAINNRILKLFDSLDIEFNQANIKTYLQDGARILTTVVSIAEFIQNNQAADEIVNLQEFLIPPPEIIGIFNRLGENFSASSGAIALSLDLDYLKNIIDKKKNLLSNEEKTLLNEYLDTIHAQMTKLEEIYAKIVNRFGKIKESIHAKQGSPLKGKIDEIANIISNKSEQQVIITNLSSDLDVIIKNMRACLSAKTKGINNDTNLTFAEPYKFYLYSRNETDKAGSIADEIVYLMPQQSKEGEQRLSFIMDIVYGQKNSDVMYNHVATLIEKLQAMHHQFPSAPLSIFITHAALSSVSANIQLLSSKFADIKDLSFTAVNETTVSAPESVFGDNYIEFGAGGMFADARKTGEIRTSGVEITIA